MNVVQTRAAETVAMRRAAQLASFGEATTRPNPNVGCVILTSDGTTVGEGWHERPGSPHAEVVALRAAGDRARGATLVVTLEPCAHTGRTGPCTVAIINAGITRVVYAVSDPTPAAGRGAEVLTAAGLTVLAGIGVAEAERTNQRWLAAARLGRPFTIWKYAATLDGRVAAADGSSRWITSAVARADVHRLRASCDAIIVGVGTVFSDDPHLTTRLPDGTLAADQPLRVIVDTHGRTPTAARVLDDAAPTWVATAGQLGAGTDGRVDLRSLAAELYERGHVRVLLEGGPRLAGSFLRVGLVDQVVGYLAPALLGAGAAALGPAGIESIDDAIRLTVEEITQLGPDVRFTGTPTIRPAPIENWK